MFHSHARIPKDGFKSKPPYSWQSLEQGEWWHQSLSRWIQEQGPPVFGNYMLTLGDLELPWHDLRVQRSLFVNEHLDFRHKEGVQASWTALPFSKDSMDWVNLPFVLEYSSDPHQVLREVDYCLRTEGYLFIVMQNPIALHHFGRCWPRWRHKKPFDSRLFMISRVKDWLSLLNYQVIQQGYFAPGIPFPSRNKKKIRVSNDLKLKWAWRYAGVVLLAQKREWPLTLLRTRSLHRASFGRKVMMPVRNSLFSSCSLVVPRNKR